MSEWTVVTVLIALVGLMATVTRPLLKLNSTMTKLSARIDMVMRDMAELKESNSEIRHHATDSHRKLHERINENAEHLQDHERRIVQLETKE